MWLCGCAVLCCVLCCAVLCALLCAVRCGAVWRAQTLFTQEMLARGFLANTAICITYAHKVPYITSGS